MFSFKKLYIALILGLLSLTLGFNTVLAKKAENPAPKTQEAVECTNINAIEVSSLDVVNNPTKYLNKDITMKATFDKFSALGLDYKKALRPTADYIGFLIQRDDKVDHDIPLSEMKLFLKRDYAEKFIDLEVGDKIQITGKVFSDALGDPWIDVNRIDVLKKAKAVEETPKTKKK